MKINFNASLDFCPSDVANMVAEGGRGDGVVSSKPLKRSVKSELQDEDGFTFVPRRNRPPVTNVRLNHSDTVNVKRSSGHAVQKKPHDGKMGTGVIPQARNRNCTENIGRGPEGPWPSSMYFKIFQFRSKIYTDLNSILM